MIEKILGQIAFGITTAILNAYLEYLKKKTEWQRGIYDETDKKLRDDFISRIDELRGPQ